MPKISFYKTSWSSYAFPHYWLHHSSLAWHLTCALSGLGMTWRKKWCFVMPITSQLVDLPLNSHVSRHDRHHQVKKSSFIAAGTYVWMALLCAELSGTLADLSTTPCTESALILAFFYPQSHMSWNSAWKQIASSHIAFIPPRLHDEAEKTNKQRFLVYTRSHRSNLCLIWILLSLLTSKHHVCTVCVHTSVLRVESEPGT